MMKVIDADLLIFQDTGRTVLGSTQQRRSMRRAHRPTDRQRSGSLISKISRGTPMQLRHALCWPTESCAKISGEGHGLAGDVLNQFVGGFPGSALVSRTITCRRLPNKRLAAVGAAATALNAVDLFGDCAGAARPCHGRYVSTVRRQHDCRHSDDPPNIQRRARATAPVGNNSRRLSMRCARPRIDGLVRRADRCRR